MNSINNYLHRFVLLRRDQDGGRENPSRFVRAEPRRLRVRGQQERHLSLATPRVRGGCHQFCSGLIWFFNQLYTTGPDTKSYNLWQACQTQTSSRAANATKIDKSAAQVLCGTNFANYNNWKCLFICFIICFSTLNCAFRLTKWNNKVN